MHHLHQGEALSNHQQQTQYALRRTVTQRLVQQVNVTISTQPNCPARAIDELIAEALNASLGDGEVVQFYPHSGLNEFGDTDERVGYFTKNVVKSVLIEEVQRKE